MYNRTKSSVCLLLAMGLSLAACSSDTETSADQLRKIVNDLNLTGDPAAGRVLPAISDPKAQLGMKVFFSKILSAAGDSAERMDSACVSCHHPMLGGGDDLPLPIGVQAEAADLLGPGRFHSLVHVMDDNGGAGGGEYDGGPTVPRNAPTTFNIALWDQMLFHDGRVESLGKTAGANGDDGSGIRTPDSAFGVADTNAGANLVAAQSRFPVTSPEEMKGFNGVTALTGTNDDVRLDISATMDVTNWDAEFDAVYGGTDGVAGTVVGNPYARIAEVIGEYERSQVFVDTPWKAFVAGDNAAISESAMQGALLFFRSTDKGGADCVSCHSGDFFTDEKFHVTAMPQIGRGKGNNNGTLTNDDFGRFRETGNAADMYAFRTPTLLNVEVTGPWSHAGAYTSLEAVVRHHLDPDAAIANYDFSQLPPNVQADSMLTNTQFALDTLAANRVAQLSGTLQNVSLSDTQVADIVEFLKALTDPCVKDRACMADWIPDAGDSNPDALRLNAVDNFGQYL